MENGADHWHQLMLSLRELVEWVVKKETELGAQPQIGMLVVVDDDGVVIVVVDFDDGVAVKYLWRRSRRQRKKFCCKFHAFILIKSILQ